MLLCFSKSEVVLSHERDTIYCLQLLGFSVFIFTNKGRKKILPINEVIKLEIVSDIQFISISVPKNKISVICFDFLFLFNILLNVR